LPTYIFMQIYIRTQAGSDEGNIWPKWLLMVKISTSYSIDLKQCRNYRNVPWLIKQTGTLSLIENEHAQFNQPILQVVLLESTFHTYCKPADLYTWRIDEEEKYLWSVDQYFKTLIFCTIWFMQRVGLRYLEIHISL
jgi:hypothetical protein